MRTARPFLNVLVLGTLTLFFLMIVAEVMARGPGGGGRGGRGGIGRGGPRGGHHMGRMHHRRVGPASRGSFSSHSRRPPTHHRQPPRSTYHRPETRPSQPRPVPPMTPEEHQKRHEALQEERQERREERDEQRERWRENRRREEVGTTYYYGDYWGDEYCEASVVVDGITYYQCEGVWYRRAYSGGEVAYVVVEGPRSE